MRLIDADALKKDVLDLPNCYNGFSDTFDKACIIGLIDEQPTIEERKKGRWMPHDCLGKPSIDNDVCSECGQRFYQIAETGCIWHYCPNCGADNRGEQDE